MRKLLLSVTVMAIAISSCKKDDDVQVQNSPDITLTTPAGGYTVGTLQWLKVNPVVAGDSSTTSFLWTIDNDTISTDKNLLYVFQSAGTYKVTLSTKNSVGTDKKQFDVVVTTKGGSRGVTKVFEYFPAPGQFTNALPAWSGIQDKDSAMAAKAETELTSNGMISLGGFGGFVVMGFDHVITDRFIVQGNAFNNWSEAGIISVSVDANGNGLPDDEWYEIAGSEYNSPETRHNYTITYYKPDENKVATPDDAYMSDTTYIRWKDSDGQSGYLSKNLFHSQSYYPQWKGDSIKFTGTRLTSNGVKDLSGAGNNWASMAFSYGYADNWTNMDMRAVIRVDWAVDSKGNYVHLPGIDFIKVHTGIRAEAGWLGEVSTEVTGVVDLTVDN